LKLSNEKTILGSSFTR